MSLWYNIWIQHKILPTLQIYNKDKLCKTVECTALHKYLNFERLKLRFGLRLKKLRSLVFLSKQTFQNITTKLFHQNKSIKLVIEVKINLVKGFFI